MRLSEFEDKKAKLEQEDLMSQYERLKDLPSDQLSRMLLDEVARQKHEGTFDYAQLVNTLDSLRAFVPAESYENIKRILESLK